MRSLLILILFCTKVLAALPQASDTLLIERNQSIIHIGSHTHYYEDTSNKLTLHNIVANKKMMQPSNFDVPNFRATRSAYWFNFRIKNKAESSAYLEIGSAFMDSVWLYEVLPSGRIIERISGDHHPFSSREIHDTRFLFHIPMRGDTVSEYYLRTETTQPHFFPLRIGNLRAFYAFSHKLNFIQGLYFGLMLIMTFYNFFLFFSVRDNSYLYYVAYSISMTFFMAFITGHFFEFLWPNTPQINKYALVSSGFTIITASVFTRSFLNIKQILPSANVPILLFIPLGGIVILTNILGFNFFSLLFAQIILLVMSLAFLYVGIYIYWKGYKPARYYLLAWTALLLGIIVGVLEGLSLFYVSPYFNAMQIGSALELALLSFALASKIKYIQEQLDYTNKKYMHAAKENETLALNQKNILEKQVEERTHDLNKKHQQLQETLADATKLAAFKKDMIKLLVHDLKSPLNVIINMSKHHLVRVAGYKMHNMVSNLIDIQQHQDSKLEIDYCMINFTDIFSNSIEQLDFLIKNKDLSCSLQLPTEQAVILYGDASIVERIFVNLLSNAIKYSEQNGKIIVTVKQHNGKFWQVDVQDFGIGIAPSHHTHIFEQYVHPEKRSLGKFRSTGLGLSFCKIATEAHAGAIWLESEEGKGSTFSITLPKAQV